MTDLSHLPLADLTLNEPARPKMPPIHGAGDAERRAGRHLAAIHRHYLSEMSKIASILSRISAGDAPPDALHHIVLHEEISKNFEAAGTLCGHQCQVLQMHHDIEEHQLFPVLAQQPHDALRRVVAKLQAEHEVIHELLRRLQQAAADLSNSKDQSRFDTAHRIFQALRAAVASHFGYEETELEEAIGVYLGGV